MNVLKLKAKTIKKIELIQKLKSEGKTAHEIADILNMNYRNFYIYCRTYEIDFSKTKTNCFTCEKMFINYKGLPDCKTKCHLVCCKTSKYKRLDKEEYNKELPCDVIGKYFNLSLTNDEALLFIQNCKEFYEMELAK